MDHLDLLDPCTFEAEVPHPYFAWLRENEPVRWNEGRPGRNIMGRQEPDQRGFWVLTRHADVTRVSKNQKLFSSGRGTALNADLPPNDLPMFQQQMIHMDPPRHTQVRNLINRGFTPRRIEAMETRVRSLAREIVAAVAAKGECDFVTEIAAELPLLVLADLLGVPHEERHKLFDWTNRLIGLEDPEYGSPIEAQAALMELFLFFANLANQRREDPTDDLISALVHAEVDGQKLTPPELSMMFFLLVVAGNETTRNAITGGLLALHDFPEEREKLLADRGLLATGVDEMIRWHTPVMQFRRTATEDTQIGGQAIAEDDKVVMFYAAANRDPAAFENADRFDITRSPNPHLGFGIGGHFCLGASLARAEMRILFEELFERLPDIQVSGPPERLRSNFINGIKHLPVAFSPA